MRLVDELGWLNGIVIQSPAHPDRTTVNRAACAVKSRVATVLERGADLLGETGGSSEALDAALSELHEALVAMEMDTTVELPTSHGVAGSADDRRVTELVTSLDPSFRAQELSFAVTQLAANIRP